MEEGGGGHGTETRVGAGVEREGWRRGKEEQEGRRRTDAE